jgi:hypothetical protein
VLDLVPFDEDVANGVDALRRIDNPTSSQQQCHLVTGDW